MPRKKAAAFDIKGLANLEKYAERIGAEQLNFRRWMVKDRIGTYYIERALITINTELRKVYFPQDPQYAPTEIEQIAIEAEIKEVRWPESIPFKNKELILKEIGNGNDVTFFPSRKKGGGFIMAQERIKEKSGGKGFRPWTVWEDGKVRAMEPSGKLPFWKPEKPRDLPMIMVHEGGKAARFVDNLVNNPAPEWRKRREAYPPVWFEYLKQFEHWGMIGGALSPHRSDYSELWDANPQQVVYVCDNDSAGRQVMNDFSKQYGRTLQFMRWSNSWPVGFDLADNWPEHFFSAKGIYKGPTPQQMLRSGTWATDIVKTGEKGVPPRKVLKRLFREEWFTTVEPEYFVNKYFPGDRWSRNQFNSWAGCFCDVADLAQLVLKDGSNKVERLIYHPAKEPGLSDKKDGESTLTYNTHKPSSLQPVEGDPAPFIEYMEHLIPSEEDRTNMMRFLATLIARPDIKMNFGVLMVSQVQGVGKSTIGESIMQEILGSSNVSFPGQGELVDSQFNAWLAHKRLIFVHEIYAGHSSKAYDKLKSAITDPTTTINMKFTQPYTIDNWAHVIACSNSMRALKLPDEDRRWFVPEITEDKKPHAWWVKFHEWLEDEQGREIIMNWAFEFLKTHKPFVSGEGAPVSSSKQKMIEEGYSPGQNLVSQTLDNISAVLKSESKQANFMKSEWEKGGMLKDGVVFFTDMQLVNLIKAQIYEGKVSDRLERPLTVRKLAKARGWHLGDIKAVLKDWPEVARHGRLISNNKIIANTPPSKLCNVDMEKGEKRFPLDLNKLEGF